MMKNRSFIPLLIASCLSTSPIIAMETVHHNETNSSVNLRDYIVKGLEIEKDLPFTPEQLMISLSVFDEFINQLTDAEKKYGTIPEKQTILFKKNAKSDFNKLLDLYTKVLGLFNSTFANNLNEDCKTKITGMEGEYSFLPGKNAIYPKHEPYFLNFQKITNTIFDLRKNCLGIEKPQGFEIIETNLKLNFFVFPDANGYVPFPINKFNTYTACVQYGTDSFPQKQFSFKNGQLIKESGIATSIRDNYLKLLWQCGAQSESPYTAGRVTARIPLELSNDPLLMAFKKTFGEDLFTGTCFLTIPTTQEEQDITEILFLEDLMNDNSTPSKDQSVQFLTWISSELNSMESAETESPTKLQELHHKLEEQMISTFEANLDAQSMLEIQDAQNKQSTQQGNVTEKKVKVKTKGNQKGKGKGKGKGKAKTTQKKPIPSAPNNRAKARALYEKVKQEGRIKFRNIINVINTIKSDVGAKLFADLINVNMAGSHASFHMKEGAGTTLVVKHGKADLTIPAKTVNHMSLKLINALLSTAISEK